TTCGTIITDLELDGEGRPRYHMRATKKASRELRDISEPYLKRCTGEALRQAGVELSDVDFCVF
ncbi:MAG: 3-oxoacyl-ACP synthase, partial [Gammaproteobacteria bacterium]|nr:3-oxoacyl-ACP synthase [Gammaproteobacteria bacterium]